MGNQKTKTTCFQDRVTSRYWWFSYSLSKFKNIYRPTDLPKWKWPKLKELHKKESVHSKRCFSWFVRHNSIILILVTSWRPETSPYALGSTFHSPAHGNTTTTKGTNLPDKIIWLLQGGLASKCRLLDCRGCHDSSLLMLPLSCLLCFSLTLSRLTEL